MSQESIQCFKSAEVRVVMMISRNDSEFYTEVENNSDHI